MNGFDASGCFRGAHILAPFVQEGPTMRARWNWLRGACAAVAGVMLLAGCASFEGPFPPPSKAIERQRDAAENVDYILQVKEDGTFWDKAAAVTALQEVEASARSANTIVVLFVHGWHHNAAPEDEDLSDFAASLKALRLRLAEPVYADSRKALTNSSDVKLIGVYIGWPGRERWSFFDYATFSSRKRAAERVGEGDVRQFVVNLNDIYEKSNAGQEQLAAGGKVRRLTAADQPVPFMGLVSIGHSFGGQVLLKATHRIFEQRLEAAITEQAASPGVPVKPLKGVGDLVVLLNPAAEAEQYKAIDSMSRQLTYARHQPPLLFVLSAANDSSRNYLFPLGRNALFYGGPIELDQRVMWSMALGAYKPQRTHEVLLDETVTGSFDPAEVYSKRSCEVVNLDLTSKPKVGSWFEKVTLDPVPTYNKPYSPFLVANVGLREIMTGHVGIWHDVLQKFVTNYVAIAQGKRMLVRAGWDKACDPAASGVVAAHP